MTQEKEINPNQINYRVYETMIRACLAEYANGFNKLQEDRRVAFNMTLTPADVSTYDVLLKQGKYKSKEEMKEAGIKDDIITVRYLRVGKFFEKVKFHTPIAEEFKPGLVYQKLDVVNKQWEELKFEEGDIIPSVELDKNQIRVEAVLKEKEIALYQQSIRLNTKQEVLNDKWWKRLLYIDLLSTLMAKGIEYGEVLELLKRGEDEKAILAKELGESAKQVLEANKIVIRKEMPKPLTPGDEKYKAQMEVARAKEAKK